MINPFNYLFYKIYTFLSHISGGGNPITHLSAMAMLISLNIFTIHIIIYDDLPPKLIFAVLILLLLPYAIPKISDRIITKYNKESEKSRLIGNTIVTLYVTLSIISFILVI